MIPGSGRFPGEGTGYSLQYIWASLVAQLVESSCNEGDLSSIPGLGSSPGGGHGNLLQYSCIENPLGQRSLAGYSPRGCKELDMTERLSTYEHQEKYGIFFFNLFIKLFILYWSMAD